MSRISAESFLSLIKQSGLIEADRLERELEDLQGDGSDTSDSNSLANSFIERELLTQWQAEKLLKGKHKGFSLGKYRLLKLLGKGGMSSVYLAEHLLMRRQCAIKVLPIKRVNDTSYLARFHREAQAVASLDHPNIVRAYDIDHEVEGDKEIHFLVMEHVNGQSLQEIIKDRGPLSLDDTAEYFRQAALGLENAHANGLIHRDVKPGNLLVDQNEVVKVLDLGLARFSNPTEDNPLTLTHDEKVLGTADYLAPEQALDSHMVDCRADIYGLGCTAYFAMTGHPPFRDGTLAQRLMWHQTKEPPEIAESRPDVAETQRGQALVDIVKKMMAKKPDERYQTMSKASEDLEQWLEMYATQEWRKAHPDAFTSGSSTSGAAVPVAKAVPVAAVAAPVADAPSTTITSTSAEETGIESQSPFTAAPVSASTESATAETVEPVDAEAADSFVPPGEAEAPPHESSDPGFGAFLSQLGDEGSGDVASVSEATDVPPQINVEPAAPVAEPVAETPEAPVVAAPIAANGVPEAEPETVSPIPAEAAPAAVVSEAAPVAAPVEVQNDIPPAAPVVTADVAPVEPVAPVAPVTAAPVEVAAPVDAPAAEVVPESVEPAAELEAAEALDPAEETPAASGSFDFGNVDVPAEAPAEPLADFDPSLIPAPVDSPDEYPSLLGGTPTGTSVPGFNEPGEAAQSEMEQTQTFVPTTPSSTELQSDATQLHPVDESCMMNVEFESPAAPPAFNPAIPEAPATPAAPVPVEPAAELQPAEPAPVFPGVPSDPADPGPAGWSPPPSDFPVPAAPVAPAVPQFPVADAPVPAAPIPSAGEPVPPFQAAPVSPEMPAFPGAPAPEVPAFGAAAQPAPAAGFPAEPQFGAPAQPAFPGAPPTDGATQFGPTAAAQPLQPAATGGKKPPVSIIAGVVVAVLAIGAGAYFAFTGDDGDKSGKKSANSGKSGSGEASSGKGSSSSGTAATGSTRTKTLGNQLKVGPAGDFSTISAALDYLKKNKSKYDTGTAARRTSVSVEVVGGETYSEGILIDNSSGSYPPGIQIVSAGVTPAKLKPSGSGPVIRIDSIENLQIKGFEVDASGKDVAIELSGFMNRSVLREMSVTGFSKTGVALRGVAGFSNQEVILEKLDFQGNGRIGASIHFASGDTSTGRIKVLNCRLLGPQETGILFETDVTYVDIRENIIADAGVGIAFRGGPLTLKDVTVANTTFYKCSQGGMVISHMPPVGGGLAGTTVLAFHRNLFAQVNGPELKIENDFDDKKFDQFFSAAGGGVEANWTDRQQAADIKNGERDIIARDNQRVQSFQFAVTDKSSPDFLTLKPNTPYASFGRPKLQTKQYIGARPAKK